MPGPRGSRGCATPSAVQTQPPIVLIMMSQVIFCEEELVLHSLAGFIKDWADGPFSGASTHNTTGHDLLYD